MNYEATALTNRFQWIINELNNIWFINDTAHQIDTILQKKNKIKNKDKDTITISIDKTETKFQTL